MLASTHEVILIGTGLAPLIAARRLVLDGRSVLLLNPDWDFFSEDSELPFDPMETIGRGDTLARLQAGGAVQVLADLKADFPGSVEFWPERQRGGFHDESAPHVRERTRLWVGNSRQPEWSRIEELYLEASDAGLNPQALDGLVALRKIPGTSARSVLPDGLRGIAVPRMSDVDVDRYRRGVLEFVQERLGDEGILRGVTQLELISGGVRFHSKNGPGNARSNQIWIFWTPRLSPWVHASAKKYENSLPQAMSEQRWEEWSLVSRDPLDPSIIVQFKDLSIWAQLEGSPSSSSGSHRTIQILRPIQGDWAGQESFEAIAELCHDLFNWDKFSVRSLKARSLMKMGDSKDLVLGQGDVRARLLLGVDGPLSNVVRRVRRLVGEMV